MTAFTIDLDRLKSGRGMVTISKPAWPHLRMVVGEIRNPKKNSPEFEWPSLWWSEAIDWTHSFETQRVSCFGREASDCHRITPIQYI
jgi:hypothetical protein